MTVSAPLDILADDLMPGVEACLAPAQTVRPIRVRRFSGRQLQRADLTSATTLWVRSVTRVDPALLDGTAVRWVGTATIGTDHLDLPGLQAMGIPVVAAPGCNARAVAEWVVMALVHTAVARGVALTGKTVGVVGLGHVGRQVAALLPALGLQVRVCDPPRAAQGDIAVDAAGVERPWTAWAALLPAVDILCLHTPWVREGPWPTHQLLSTASVSALKQGCWVLNAGRGEVIAREALIDSHSPVAAWLLDVWPQEPHLTAEMLSCATLASPHIAGHSLEGKWRGTHQIATAWCAAHDLPPPPPLADLLPPEPPRRLPPGLSAGLAAVHDLVAVDQALRASLQEPDPVARFDALRRAAGQRREFSAWQCHPDTASSDHDILGALGFCC